MTSSSNLLLVLEEKDNMGDMRTPAKGKSCGLLPRLPDCKYSVPCASLCNDHYVIIVIIMCVFHDLKKKIRSMGWQWMAFSKKLDISLCQELDQVLSAVPCHPMFENAESSASPRSKLSPHLQRSQHLRAATPRTYPTLAASLNQGGDSTSWYLAPTRANRTDLQGKCFCRSFGRQALQPMESKDQCVSNHGQSDKQHGYQVPAGLRNHCEEDMFLVMQTKHMFLWPIDCWRH